MSWPLYHPLPYAGCKIHSFHPRGSPGQPNHRHRIMETATKVGNSRDQDPNEIRQWKSNVPLHCCAVQVSAEGKSDDARDECNGDDIKTDNLAEDQFLRASERGEWSSPLYCWWLSSHHRQNFITTPAYTVAAYLGVFPRLDTIAVHRRRVIHVIVFHKRVELFSLLYVRYWERSETFIFIKIKIRQNMCYMFIKIKRCSETFIFIKINVKSMLVGVFLFNYSL